MVQTHDSEPGLDSGDAPRFLEVQAADKARYVADLFPFGDGDDGGANQTGLLPSTPATRPSDSSLISVFAQSSSCCDSVVISSTNDDIQEKVWGTYNKIPGVTHGGRPAYKHVSTGRCLWFSADLWGVSDTCGLMLYYMIGYTGQGIRTTSCPIDGTLYYIWNGAWMPNGIDISCDKCGVYKQEKADKIKAQLTAGEGNQCYIKMPTGCNNDLAECNGDKCDPEDWFKDPQETDGDCTAARKDAFNAHCGRTDAEQHLGNPFPQADFDICGKKVGKITGTLNKDIIGGPVGRFLDFAVGDTGFDIQQMSNIKNDACAELAAVLPSRNFLTLMVGNPTMVDQKKQKKQQRRLEASKRKDSDRGKDDMKGDRMKVTWPFSMILPLCFAVRPCGEDNDSLWKGMSVGFYSDGGIPLATVKAVEFTLYGVAYDTTGSLQPPTFDPPFFGGAKPNGMHFWMKVEASIPLKRLGKLGPMGKKIEELGDMAIEGQVGFYNEVNCESDAAAFFEELLDGSDIETMITNIQTKLFPENQGGVLHGSHALFGQFDLDFNLSLEPLLGPLGQKACLHGSTVSELSPQITEKMVSCELFSVRLLPTPPVNLP